MLFALGLTLLVVAAAPLEGSGEEEEIVSTTQDPWWNVIGSTISTWTENVTHSVIINITAPPTSTYHPCYFWAGGTTTTQAPTTTQHPCEIWQQNQVQGDAPQEKTEAFVAEKVRLCSCEEAASCRKSSQAEMQSCYASCDSHLMEFAGQQESYVDCYEKDSTIIEESETCLYENLTNYCAKDGEQKLISKPNFRRFESIELTGSSVAKTTPATELGRKHLRQYGTFNRFLSCAKNCMHKKMYACVNEKGCSVRLPLPSEFKRLMGECTKKNNKIAWSFLRTCQCLAYQKGVTDLIGTCVVVGQPTYVNNN